MSFHAEKYAEKLQVCDGEKREWASDYLLNYDDPEFSNKIRMLIEKDVAVNY